LAAHEAKLAAALDESRKHQSERDKLTAALAQEKATGNARAELLQKQLDSATARLKKHVDGALTFEPDPQSWEEALNMCSGDYAKAKAKYGALLVEFKTKEGKK
jgi:uncharacterized protein YfeS